MFGDFMKNYNDLLSIAASSTVPVLLQGESGVGKEVAARRIHSASDRRDKPFIALNCAAIAHNIAESILEGARRGAYTGAVANQEGVVRAANNGTLFLDEIGEMPIDLQSKLLRILQERSVMPLGATQSIPVNFRLICATNRNLKDEVVAGRFRQDLYFRINVFPVEIPPLRKRSDLKQIARSIWQEATCGEMPPLTTGEMERLSKFNWPGNIRQLKNVLQRLSLLRTYGVNLEEILAEESAPPTTFDCREIYLPAKRAECPDWATIQKALAENDGNKSRAAKSLGISRGSLCYQIRKHESEIGFRICI